VGADIERERGGRRFSFSKKKSEHMEESVDAMNQERKTETNLSGKRKKKYCTVRGN